MRRRRHPRLFLLKFYHTESPPTNMPVGEHEIHVSITGRVQGVNFRRFVKKHADELGVTGLSATVPTGRLRWLPRGPRQTSARLPNNSGKGRILPPWKTLRPTGIPHHKTRSRSLVLKKHNDRPPQNLIGRQSKPGCRDPRLCWNDYGWQPKVCPAQRPANHSRPSDRLP